jgi:hypothetical protein
MVHLICPRWAHWMVRAWCVHRVACLNEKVPSGRKGRRGKPRTGSMPVVLRRILSHQAPRENLELIFASKETAYGTANFMPAPAWQEIRTIPDLRRL